MSMPKVGMALIVRDEADTIADCLGSFWNRVDYVAILDTGSKDGTLDAVHEFADQWVELAPDPRGPQVVTGTFEWCDDFSAARTAAEALLPADVDWVCWIDADDRLHGAEHLRPLAAQASPDLSAYVFGYDYARDEHGQSVCYLKRERLVRRGHGTWGGRVHEAQSVTGAIAHVDPQLVEWRHHKPLETADKSNTRNLRLLRKWVKDEPTNPRVLMYLGTEELITGRHKRALAYFKRYLAQPVDWTEERAQVHRKIAVCHQALDDHQAALQVALQAIAVMPEWPDSYLTLAESHYNLGEPAKAAVHARRVLELGPPQTALIVNPCDYQVQPHVILAGAHAGAAQFDEAIAYGEQVLARQPGHPVIAREIGRWRATRKREQTADTFAACASLLVEHDEQLKALEVLRAVPHYCIDHPRVVAARSALRERIDHLFDVEGYRDHYEFGGSKPEDGIADDNVLPLGDALPRCGYLLAGLREQAQAAT